MVGEQPGHRDEREASPQLLQHQVLGLAVKGLQAQQSLDDLVVFFHAPARRVEVGQGVPGVALAVEQGGREGVVVAAGGVVDKARRDGLQDGIGLLLRGRLGGLDGDGAVGVVALDEVADEAAGIGLQAEDGMQAAPGAGVQQGEAVVAAVEDDDVAGAQGAQVVAGRPALVLVAGEVEVEGQAGRAVGTSC